MDRDQSGTTEKRSEMFSFLDRRHREILINVALVAVSVMIVFAGLEAGLRLGAIPYERPVTSEDIHCTGPNGLHKFHPEYGWTVMPERTYIRHWKNPTGEDEWYFFSTSKEGFRDTYDAGERNVLVLGDSFTEGAGVTEGGQYPALLDHWFPNTSFRAYGAGGYGTDQELLIYRNISGQFEHDLVILAYYYGNDANNNAGHGWPPGPRRPHFEIQDGRLVQTHEPVDKIPYGAAGFTDYGVIGEIHRSLSDWSWAYHWTYRRGRALVGKVGLFSNTEEQGPPSPPTGKELRSQLDLTRALLMNLSSTADAHNADVLIVGIPARGEIQPDTPAHYPPEQGIPYYQAQRHMVKEVSENRDNVLYLDLAPTLRQEVENGNQVYGQDVANAHFIAYGYQVMADAIYDRVTTEGYLPNRPARSGQDYRINKTSC